MKKVKLWAHATYQMVEHDDFSRRLNLPAYVRLENYDFLVRRCENLESENALLKAKVKRLTSNNARLKEAIDDSYKAVADMEKRMQEWDEEILNVEIAKNAKLREEIEQLKEAWVDKKMQEDRDNLLAKLERLTKAIDLTLVDLDERHERQDLRACEFAELLRKAKGVENET